MFKLSSEQRKCDIKMEVEEPVPGTAERILLGKQTPEDEDEEGGCGGCAGGGGGRVKGEWTL